MGERRLKEVTLVGMYGATNFGDELLLNSLITFFREQGFDKSGTICR